jgi:GNAT superfamily N-acetyltransferase
MSNVEINTRPAVRSDVPSLLQMTADLAAFHGDQATISENELISLAFAEHPWITAIVAEYENVIVGYAALCPLIQLQWGKKGMDIHHLFVAESHRGTGVGRALILASIDQAKAKGCSYLAVGTHPDNAGAQEFYSRNGFVARGSGLRFRIDF